LKAKRPFRKGPGAFSKQIGRQKATVSEAASTAKGIIYMHHRVADNQFVFHRG
jgi:hypothetical protein